MININRLSSQEKNTRREIIDFALINDICLDMVYKKILNKKQVLSDNIKRYLVAKNLKQNEFAEQIGLSPQHFNFYATGKREPKEETLNLIARGLNIDPLELYRIPPGMADPDIEHAWNCLIELQADKNAIELAKEFLSLLLSKDDLSQNMISAIRQLLKAVKHQ